ncbi:MAG: serine hydrolase [Patescibacteria group bacterium]
MRKRKVDLLLFLLPFFAVISIAFCIFYKKPSIRSKTYPNGVQKEEIGVNSYKRPIVDDAVFFKSIDERLSYLRNKIGNESGSFGLFIKDLDTNEEYSVNSNEKFYGASLYKIPLAAAVITKIEAEDLSYNTIVSYERRDYSDGTGSISESSYGTNFSVSELLDYLMRQSDNVAQMMLERTVTEIYLSEIFKDLSSESDENTFYIDNTTYPREVVNILEIMFYKDYISENNKTLLKNFMYPTLFDDRITPSLKNQLTFYHKIGSWPDSWHDCGIVTNGDKDVIVCLMSKDTNYESFLNVSSYVGSFINSLF